MGTDGQYGASTEYRLLHYWVEKQLGKPLRCDECGATEKRRYHWANVSGEYKRELSDWRRLCVPCHARESNWGRKPGKVARELCIRGHALTEGNIYYHPSNGVHYCLTCKRAYNSQYYRNRLLKAESEADK